MPSYTLNIIVQGHDQASGPLGAVSGALGGLGALAKGTLAVGLGVATAAFGGMTAALGLSMKEAMDAQTVEAQLDAVLKSTAGAAGINRDSLLALASGLQSVTRFSDDTIISGEAMLLTFTNIGKDVFPDTTKVMLDMAQAMGGDLQGTAIQLGKALNDPKEGLSALSRVGVTFTEEQKNLIKSLQDAGDMAGAQKVILAELQKEFGGSAEAAGKTFAGQLDILKNRLLDVAEGIGTKLLPIGEELLTKFGPAITSAAEQFAAWVDSPQFQTGMQSLIITAEQLSQWLAVNLPVAIQALSGFWTNTLQPALVNVWTWMQGSLFPALSQLWAWLQINLPIAIQALSDFWTTTLQPAIASVWAWAQTTLIPFLGELWGWLQINIPVALQTLSNFWTTTLQPAIASVWGWMQGTLFPMLSDLWTWLQINVPIALQTLSNFWTGTLQPAITQVWGWVTGTLFPMLSDLWTWLSETMTAALQTLSDFWTTTLLPAITSVWSWMNETLFPFLKSLQEFFDAAFTLAITAMAGLWEKTLQPALEKVWKYINDNVMPIFEKISTWFSDVGKKAIETFTPIVQGLVSGVLTDLQNIWGGINQGIKDATQWLQDMADKLNNITLPDWMQPGSPTPWEMGLRGVNTALSNVIRGVGSLDSELSGMAQPKLGFGGALSGVGATDNRVTNNYYNLSVASMRSTESVVNDFAVQRILAGA